MSKDYEQMREYQRGYQDGYEAGREFAEHAPDPLYGVSEVLYQQLLGLESEEYREGYRAGFEDAL